MDRFLELIGQAFAWLKNLVQRVIRGVLSFARDILNRFRGLSLNPTKDIPFLMDAKSEQFQNMLKSAPVKNVGVFGPQQEGIFSGVYDEETNEILHAELLSADQLDAKTKEIMGESPLVVLS